jgi:hypothetical protein
VQLPKAEFWRTFFYLHDTGELDALLEAAAAQHRAERSTEALSPDSRMTALADGADDRYEWPTVSPTDKRLHRLSSLEQVMVSRAIRAALPRRRASFPPALRRLLRSAALSEESPAGGLLGGGPSR